MAVWSLVVELVRMTVFAFAHVCGGSVGAGILAVSVLVRLALLPVTLRVARRALEHQKRLAELRPELERLRRKYGRDSAQLAEATMRLYRERGIGLVPPGALRSALIQLPIGAALYQAFSSGLGLRLRFLWVADLARPDAILAILAAILTAAATAAGTTSANRTAVALSAGVTLLVAWRLSASVALYWLASSGVGAVQAMVLRRDTKRSIVA